MDQVQVFVCSGRFKSVPEMRGFIDETYTEDGDGLPSAFILEVELDDYEPNCIEAIPSATGEPLPLSELLAGASYADQWVPLLDGGRLADAAICVYPPNVVVNPSGSSLEYLGAFPFVVEHPEWLQRILRGEALAEDAKPDSAG